VKLLVADDAGPGIGARLVKGEESKFGFESFVAEFADSRLWEPRSENRRVNV
jgi:hypothetical protein